MTAESIKNYFVFGFDILADRLQFYGNYLLGQLTLPVIIEILIIAGLLVWLGLKIKHTLLARIVPKLIILGILMLISNFLGFWAVFYLLTGLTLIFIIATINIYQADVRQIVENLFISKKVWQKVQPLDKRELTGFAKDLSDTIITLARSKISALLIMRTAKSINRLAETGMLMNAPFTKELVLEVFSHRSGLSIGAMIIDNGIILAVGATLAALPTKHLTFKVTDPIIQQVAANWGALIVITHKDSDDIALLHGDNIYSKLAPNGLDRVLKNIFLSK